jgi:hypothetical protein
VADAVIKACMMYSLQSIPLAHEIATLQP